MAKSVIQEIKVFCGGINLDLNLNMSAIDLIFSFMDMNNYLTIKF